MRKGANEGSKAMVLNPGVYHRGLAEIQVEYLSNIPIHTLFTAEVCSIEGAARKISIFGRIL